MKALVILILLFLSVGRVGATAPNTGPLPEFCVKLEFSGLEVTGVEPSSWELLGSEIELGLLNGEVMIRVFDFVLKDDEEVIGFSWTITGARADFTVKHGRTVLAYNNEFTTTDRKGVSNAVWCLEDLEELPVEDPDDDTEEEDPDIDEPPVDEPEVEDPEDEEPEVDEPPVDEPDDEEPPVDESPVEDPDDEEPPVDDEPEVDDDDEPLPQTSDAATTSLNLFILLLGLMLTVKSLD